MKNLHVIPTDKSCRVGRFVDTQELILRSGKDIPRGENVNIYITNDEKPKDGDWVLGGLNDIVVRWKSHFTANWKKVILTTDQYLYGVQAIDDEFLQWFVKNPGCEEVEVENSSVVKEHIFDGSNDGEVIWEYKIIIPQEELREEEFCHYSGLPSPSAYIEQPKQELLPDFKITKNIFDFVNDLSDTKKEEPKQDIPIHILDVDNTYAHLENGTIVVEKNDKTIRTYSEEEVGELVYNIIGEYGKHYGIMIDGAKLNELFEQFKKK